MKIDKRACILMLALFTASIHASGVEQILEVNETAESWVSRAGQPLYYASTKSWHSIDNQTITKLSTYRPQARISLSPNGEYRLVSVLQDISEIKEGERYSDYYVLDTQDELLYTVSRGTDADLKPLVAAISNTGYLALADPVRAMIYIYKSGILVSEGQLYQDDGNMSLERNILMQWVGEQCYILLERPGYNGGPAGNALFMRISSDGRDQSTSFLPFTYLSKKVFQNQRFFVSGYNYIPEKNEMLPMIVELTAQGELLWNNENFGHELTLSENGRYLAALSSHEFIQIFDLTSKRVEKFHFDNDNKVCIGLAVNDQADIAVIRVAADFFAKRNTHFAQIFFPRTNQNIDIEIDPRYPKLFQIQTDGQRFFIGTNYEWLEILQ